MSQTYLCARVACKFIVARRLFKKSMASGAEGRLLSLNIVLPAPPGAGGNYLPAKTVGRLVYLSGVISTGSHGVITGTVGVNRSIEEGYEAAKSCGLTQLSVLKHHLGSLDAIKQIVSVNGYVNAVASFPDSPESHQWSFRPPGRVVWRGGPTRAHRDRRARVAS